MSDLQDIDGDSQMGNASSPSSDSDAMFPTSNVHQESSSQPALQSLGAISSPPASQDLPHQNSAIDGEAEAMDTASQDTFDRNGVAYQDQKSDFARSAESEFEPGATWNNKKARDEWQRAWNQLEDKGFSLKEFGDPFDESQVSGSTYELRQV